MIATFQESSTVVILLSLYVFYPNGATHQSKVLSDNYNITEWYLIPGSYDCYITVY